MNNEEKLQNLQKLIKEVYAYSQTLRNEADGILDTSEMPDSKRQLDDVLQTTESAAVTILEATSAIGAAIAESTASEATKQAVNDETMKIFEACSFQDISGQRIKKIISRISVLEDQLKRLSDLANMQASSTPAPAKKPAGDPLMSGPQLSGEGPSQADVDQLFSNGNNA